MRSNFALESDGCAARTNLKPPIVEAERNIRCSSACVDHCFM
jgi:hypothetical protein